MLIYNDVTTLITYPPIKIRFREMQNQIMIIVVKVDSFVISFRNFTFEMFNRLRHLTWQRCPTWQFRPGWISSIPVGAAPCKCVGVHRIGWKIREMFESWAKLRAYLSQSCIGNQWSGRLFDFLKLWSPFFRHLFINP